MANISSLGAAIPSDRFLDPATQDISPSWRAFLTALWRRTGSTVGQSTDTTALEAEIAAETQNRVAADNTLGTDITNEAAIRAAADTGLQAGINAEALARQVADNTKLPFNYPAGGDLSGTYPAPTLAPGVVCSYWRGCNLSTLPTTDPGHGQPWLNSGVVTVGTPLGTMARIGLEDGSGDWATESGGGTDWNWG